MSDNIDPEEAKALVQSVIQSGAIVPARPTSIVQTEKPPLPQDIAVTAENADEMKQCQGAIIDWCSSKVDQLEAEWKEVRDAYDYAVKQKWRNDVLKRQSERAFKRFDFYKRMLIALEHGYQIVPSFPVTAFAIRTDKKNPLRMYTTSWQQKHTQEPPVLPTGEGEYKNPFPLVRELQITPATKTTSEKKSYWADSWKDLEFPLSMAKPQIMEATTRAMALKIFDDVGILPGYHPSEGTRPPRGDPIIVARLLHPGTTHKWATKRYVTFIIAWHLNTADL